MIINNLRITQCHSSKGGAIYNKEGTLNIINTTLTHNKATDGDGGAINNLRGNVTITNSNLDHNTAMQNGGAIFTQNGILTITKSNLTHNNATEPYRSGGAIDNYYNRIVTITDSNITYNNANYNGGAIYILDGTCKISDTIFYNNLPANFILNDNNHIQLVEYDGFLTINDFIIITDYEIYHGNGQESLEQYTIPADALNVKLVLTGTNTKDNIFIIKGMVKK